ncbi:universal stress protein [Pelagibacterium lacus]|uniref:Universal stress protein n=1 Tax=Pelagibacterium lacus TaxID=2282655 RepID=A0A369W3H9_9HYPH|nr:universal stress protein [Pelagibacterium lacus]RDE07832.1 universal stress protein [Pelagibacterium lacus]
MYTHILVPTDGSELAQYGVSHALSLAKALGSKVTIITATEPFPIIYGRYWQPGLQEAQQFEEINSKAAAELLASTKAEAEKMGIVAETVHVPNQTAATAIVEAAASLGCNLIVMSSHGRRGIARALLGSQTTEVLTQSTVPVLVVR